MRCPENPTETAPPGGDRGRRLRASAIPRPARTCSLPAAVLALLLLGPARAPAQAPPPDACPDGVISYIFIDNHSVFDTDEIGPDQSFRWAYELANTLHMDTREGFVRAELLFEEGDCYDPLLMAESGRLLRGHRFIARADVFGLRQSDGSWHVVVDTKDEWTTELNVRFNFEEGMEFRGVDLAEGNVLGRGVLVGGFLVQRDDRRDIGGRIFVPRTLGTRLDAVVSAGSTRTGTFFEQELAYPFVGEVGRGAGRQRYRRRKDRFTYRPGPDSPFTHVLLPVDEETVELTVAARLGEPGNLTVFGLGFANYTLAFPGYPASVDVARDAEFDDTEPAPEEVAEALRDQTRYSSGTRVNLLFGQRNVRFVQRAGLDALTGIQDIPVGPDVGLTLGRSVGSFGFDGAETDDVYARLRVFYGLDRGPALLNVSGAWETRQVLSGGRAGRGWKDHIGELDALLYWQSPALRAHTLFGRITASGGWKTTLPFQLTLGGPTGVRGYPEETFPGARRAVLTLEDRFYVPWPAPRLIDLGFTFFADVGRMWPGDVPFGTDSGWRGSVGTGIRLGFPAGTRGVARLDLAFPLDRERAGSPILRVALVDVVGLRRLFGEPQLERSRPNPVGPDLFSHQGVIR